MDRHFIFVKSYLGMVSHLFTSSVFNLKDFDFMSIPILRKAVLHCKNVVEEVCR